MIGSAALALLFAGGTHLPVAVTPAAATVAVPAAAPGSSPVDHATPAAPALGPPRADTVVAFVGVQVIPMTEEGERVLRDRTVLVRDGRIEAVGPAAQVEVPEDALVAARGGWLLPGLAEMHAHVPPGEAGRWQRDVLYLYLANGITTIRGMLGEPGHLELRRALEEGRVTGPRLHTSGPSVNGNSVPTPDSARRTVWHQHRAGYDFLKIHPGLTRPTYDALVEEARRAGIPWAGHVPADVGLWRALEAGQATIDHLDGYVRAMLPEAREGGEQAGGEGGGERGEEGGEGDGREAPPEAGFFGFALVDRVDASRIGSLARATRQAGVWNVPTQSLIERVYSGASAEELASRPEMRYVPARMLEGWKRAMARFRDDPLDTEARRAAFLHLRRDLIAALHREGAGLLLGSDAPQIFQVPGFSLHDELALMVRSGLSPWEALATGTRNVARFFGTLEESGTVEEGKRADLLLLEANPLEAIAHSRRIAGVMADGRWHPAEELKAGLEAIAREAP